MVAKLGVIKKEWDTKDRNLILRGGWGVGENDTGGGECPSLS